MGSNDVKNRDDLRFRKREAVILKTLIKLVKNKEYALTIRPSMVYRRAGMVRSTFRRHYFEVGDVFRQKDKELMREYRKVVGGCKDLNIAWRKTLYFMMKNREMFELKFKQTDDRLVRRMVEKLCGAMGIEWLRYERRAQRRIFEMCYAELLGVMNIWMLEGMMDEMTDGVAAELTRLLRTADKRWAAVVTNGFDSFQKMQKVLE